MLMKSEVEMKGKHWEDAKATLEAVLKLPQVVDPRPDAMDAGPQQSTFFPFGQEERARIFLNLVSVYCELGTFD